MSFALDWLDLREPADHASRDRGLLRAAAKYLLEHEAPVAVDLGAGSGSTIRAFALLDPAGAAHARLDSVRWRLVDRDGVLLSAARSRMGERIEIRRAELQAVEELPLDGARLVTASALLDLVSAAWIGRLADRLVAGRLGFYAALNYDGSTAWEPAWSEDRAVLAAFNEDQRSDKGFGLALGPDAAPALARAMADRGYRVEIAPSAWRLGPGQRILQASLVEGIAAAAARAGSAEAEAWGQARRAEAMAGLSSCTVGHVDVLALPT